MKKEGKLLRGTFLNGSAWSTERIQRKMRHVLGVEHRLRKEEMEEQFDREAKEGCRLATDAARISDGGVSSDDRKHTSGGVFVAVDRNSGINPRNVRGGVRIFAVFFWHSEMPQTS